MKTIEYKKFIFSDNLLHVNQVIEAYRNIYAVEPWHEFLKCNVCDTYWGKKRDRDEVTKNGFSHCGSPMVDFWPRDVVYQNFLNNSKKIYQLLSP